MPDRKILFTARAHYATLEPVTYEAGQVVTLREDLADRWLARGVATDDAAAIEAAEAAARPAPPAPPEPPPPPPADSSPSSKRPRAN